MMTPPPGEQQQAQRTTASGYGEVLQNAQQALFGSMPTVGNRTAQPRQILFGAAIVFEAPQAGRGKVQVGQRIGQAARQHLPELELAAQNQQAGVGQQGESGAQAIDAPVHGGCFPAARGAAEQPSGQAQQRRPDKV